MAALASSPCALRSSSEFLGQGVAAAPPVQPVQKVQRVQRVVALFSKKKPTAKKVTKAAGSLAGKAGTAVKKAIKPVTGSELAKWYGPDRRVFLPEGLLDKSDIPDYLTGEVAGDYGYDPLGLGKKPKDFAQYQAAELIHARWAMLGAAGFILPEAFSKFGAVCGPEAVWFKTGAQLLKGDALEYFGITVPVTLAVASFFEIILVGGAEYYRFTNKSPLGSGLDNLHPGGAFDPLGLSSDPDQFAILKVKEIKNGRLAMFAMLGFFFQAYVTGEGPVENLTKHLSDPFGNNLLTVIQGEVERLPTL